MRRSILAGLAACAVLAAPAVGQEPTPEQPQAPVPDSLVPVLMELQTLQQRLGAIQQQALESDTTLQRRETELQTTIRSAMSEIDPEVEHATARLDTLQGMAMEAQAEQDTARLESLALEAQTLQEQLEAAQQQAMTRDDVASELEEFRRDLRVAMVQVDPEADELIDRFETLVRRLQPDPAG